MEEILVHANYIHWQGGNLVGLKNLGDRDRLLRSDMVFLQRLCSSPLNLMILVLFFSLIGGVEGWKGRRRK